MQLNDLKRLSYAKTYAWVFNDAKEFRKPIPYKHPSWAVIWVKLPDNLFKLDRVDISIPIELIYSTRSSKLETFNHQSYKGLKGGLEMQAVLFNNHIEKRLWESADQLRANSKLKSSEYSVPVLGLIFLRFADHRFAIAKDEIEKQHRDTGSRRSVTKADYQARGVLYLPKEAQFSNLLNLSEGENIGKAINDAMRAIEGANEDLKDVLPKTYNRLENDVLVTLLKIFSSVPMNIEGDVFGKIYEYFLSKFAMAEGQRGGEFFTSRIVQPIRALAIRLDIKNENLRRTRDLLLSKLISGEIDVEKFDINTEAINNL